MTAAERGEVDAAAQDIGFPSYTAFVTQMAQGPCLCAEIPEDDRPCLTCEAQDALRSLDP